MGDNDTALLFRYLLYVVMALTCVTSAPVQRRSVDMAGAHRYLKQFGYMTSDNPTDNEVTDGMTIMQRFFGLRETGELDEDTVNTMSQPRCGVADYNPEMVPVNCTPGDTSCRRRRYTTLGAPWDSVTLTYRFNNYTPDLNQEQVRSAIARALGVWEEVSPLSFTRKIDGVGTRTASDIEIVFGGGFHGINHPADSSFDGSSANGGFVLAHAFNPGSVRFPDLRGDMHFDEDELWQEAGGIDLYTVAAHEFGHSLGLGHSDIRGALMFPTYYGYDPNFRLHEDDIQGIQSLYGPRPITQNPSTQKDSALLTTPRPTNTMMTAPKIPTTENLINCGAIYDTTATLYSVYNDITTVAIKDNKSWRFATEDTILPVAFENAEESTFNIFWEASADPLSALVEKQDGSLVVIRGSQYWEYEKTALDIQLKSQFPRSLSLLGLPANVDIVAALTKRGDNKVFLFSNTQFWAFDGNLDDLELGSPMTIQEGWPGIPNEFNAAFSWQENSYFIKGEYYWCYNETTSQVDPEFPRLFSVDWLGCDSDTPSRASILTAYYGLLMVSLCSLLAPFLSK